MKRCSKIFAWFCTLITLITLFSCFVSASEQDVEEFETEKIEVTDIVITDYNSTLEVGETLTLSVTVLPSDATEQTVSYKSLNEAIATVSPTGEIKGIASGKVKIQVSAGTIKKEIDLTVKVSAKGINIKNDYIVLKPDQTQQIVADIFPNNTTQKNLTYSSLNTAVATVSDTGLIRAINCGSTSIVVKSADTMAMVSVVVNKNFDKIEDTTVNQTQSTSIYVPETINATEYPIITEEMLEQLYETKTKLNVVGNNYSFQINGQEIKNINNSLSSNIQLVEEDNNLYFTLNEKRNLCGNITLTIKNAENYRYLYLYNETEDKYKFIETSDFKNLNLSSAGRYMLTNSKINYFNTPLFFIIVGAVVLVILSIIYIIFKRKYWFW